jgi:polyhydroxybutyrate depolymerase
MPSTRASHLLPATTTSRLLPSTKTTTAAPRPPAAGPAPSASAGCGAGLAAGTTVLALPGGRRALIAVPGEAPGHRRLGLVIGLPGYGQTPEQLAAQSRLPARAMAAGVLAVLPQGAGPARSWNFSGTTGYDDLAFLSALVTRLVTSECADPARIVIAGISDGGDMAAFAACGLQVRFRAVVTVAASTEPRPNCRPIRIIAVHGDADPLDPYGGGPDSRRGYPATPPALPAIAAWAALDGCVHAIASSIAPHIVTTTYSCGAQLVTVKGGGHTWPGGAPVTASLGVTTREYDATATILGLI